MPENPSIYTIGLDEKVAAVMVYTATSLYWGEVVVKSLLRVSSWLRTNTVPDRITLYSAKGIVTNSGSSNKPNNFQVLIVPLSSIQMFHLMPPAQDPLDYDPSEPNRRMECISALVSTFIIAGNLRLPTGTSLRKHLEVTREAFTTLYDAHITNLVLPSFGMISVSSVLVRQETTIFASPS